MLREGSTAQRIAALEIGESYAQAKLLPPQAPTLLQNALREEKRKMRNFLNKQAERARNATNNAYRIDTLTSMAPEDSSIYVMVVVTRSA